MSDSLTLRPFDNGLTPPEKNLRFLVEGWRNWILHDWLIRKIYHVESQVVAVVWLRKVKMLTVFGAWTFPDYRIK